MEGKIGVKFWHSGVYKTVASGDLVYEGGLDKTKHIDPDLLSYFDIIELGKECCGGKDVLGVCYLIPGMSLSNGLRKVENDNDLLEIAALGKRFRVVDIYLYHGMNYPELEPLEPEADDPHFKPVTQASECTSKPSKHKKSKPKRGPPTALIPVRSSPRTKKATKSKLNPKGTITSKKQVSQKQLPEKASSTSPLKQSVPSSLHTSPQLQTKKTHTTTESPDLQVERQKTPQITLKEPYPVSQKHSQPVDDTYEWKDNRPESPLKLNQLIEGYDSDGSDEVDPSYDPYSDKGKGVAGSSGKGCVQDKFFVDVYTDEDSSDEDGTRLKGLDTHVNDEYEDSLGTGLEGLDAQFDDEYEEGVLNGGELYDSDVSDEEYFAARERVRACTSHLVQVAAELAKEAVEGKTCVENQEKEQPPSEYEDSCDDEQTPPPSDDDELVEGTRERRSGLLVSPTTDFSKFVWKVGLRFAKKDDFKEAVAKYAVYQGKNLVISDSNKKRSQRIGVKCIKGCPFRIYASWHTGKAAILVKRVCSQHTCQRNMKKNRQLKAKWVAQQFIDVFKTRPHWPAKEIVECIRRAYKVIVNRVFAYKVKYATHKLLHGSMHEHYKKVGGYLGALQKCSPGTHTDLVTVMTKMPSPVFQRLFICYEGLAKGWKEGCRRVLAVDSCFLKTFLGGVLLCAVGRDSNDQMYPVAWGVAEGENTLSWEWFFKNIQTCLDLGKGDGAALLSDEHQAILSVVSSVLPNAEHRHCARHVFANWHKTYRGDELKLQFWKIAKAYNMVDFEDALEELNGINPEAAEAFKLYNPSLFCRAHFNTEIKTDAITSNIAETFNGYIIQARTKHLLYMLEEIRTGLMQRLVKKRQDMEKASTVLCPRIQSKLDKEKDKATHCEVIPSTDKLFNVTYYLDQLVVDVEARTCTCRKWDMLGIPCCHAVACIYFLNEEAEDYVDACYSRTTYLKAYAGSIPPMEGERYWPRVNAPLDPPPIKIGPGRPRKNRIKDPFENPKKPGSLTKTCIEMTCSVCKSKGHNKRKCPNKEAVETPSEPPTKKPRGRPRKDGQATQITVSQPPSTPSTAPEHHSMTAQPTLLGRNGRAIRGGVGARGAQQPPSNRGRGQTSGSETRQGRGGGSRGGGSRGGGSRGGRSRGGRSRGVPRGIGVYIAEDGSAHPSGRGTTVTMSSRRPLSEQALNMLIMGQQSQANQQSTINQQSQ